MESRQYLKMLIRGRQPQLRMVRTFFVLDGKIYLISIEYIERDKDFNVCYTMSVDDKKIFSKLTEIDASQYNVVTDEAKEKYEEWKIKNDLLSHTLLIDNKT